MPKRTCSVVDCDRPVAALGYCDLHYRRQKRSGGDTSPPRKTPSRPYPQECKFCGVPFMGARRNNTTCSADGCQRMRRDVGLDVHLAKKRMAKRLQRPPCRTCGGPISVLLGCHRVYCSDPCRAKDRSKQASVVNRKKLYGVTPEQVAQMLANQGGDCAICRKADWPALYGKAGPHVDHDHVTGKVRGILCQSCNHGLGKFKDDPKRLRAAADYLEAAAD